MQLQCGHDRMAKGIDERLREIADEIDSSDMCYTERVALAHNTERVRDDVAAEFSRCMRRIEELSSLLDIEREARKDRSPF